MYINISNCSNHWQLRFFLVLALLVGFLFSGCIWIDQSRENFPTPESAIPIDENSLFFSEGNRIIVDPEDVSKFVSNILGPEFLRFQLRTDFYWFEISGNDLRLKLDKLLSEANWQLESDWGYQNLEVLQRSTWIKKDLELSILLFDDLDPVGIDSLSKNYGIVGPVPGSTMIVLHFIDKAAPKP